MYLLDTSRSFWQPSNELSKGLDVNWQTLFTMQEILGLVIVIHYNGPTIDLYN